MDPFRPSRPRAPILAVLAPFAALCAVPLARADLAVFDATDETLFHHPTILAFARALPRPDLSDYPSATTPLYHLLLSLPARWPGLDLGGLRVLGLLLALAALGVATAHLVARAGAARGVLLAALVGASPYFVGPAVRLSTDDVALLWVFAAFAVLDVPGGASVRRIAAGAVLGALAVWTRQVHLWIAGLVLLAALRPAPGAPPRPVAAALALLPPIAFAPLALAWGGTTPPSFARHDAAFNPDVLVYVLALLGAFGAFFAPWLWRVPGSGRRRWALAGAAFLAGGALLLLHPLPWVADPTRYGGAVWSLAGRSPSLAGSPALLWVLVPAGLAVAGVLALRARHDPLPAAALLLFTAANIPSARVYEKYYAPFLLFLLGRFVAGLAGDERRWPLVGPAALLAGLIAVDVVRFVL